MPHRWVTKKANEDPTDLADFCWVCEICGTDGGSLEYGPRPFLAGPAVILTYDCDTSQSLMVDYIGTTIRCIQAELGPHAAPYIDLLKRAVFSIPARTDAMRVLAGVAFDMTYQAHGVDTFKKRFKQAGWRTL